MLVQQQDIIFDEGNEVQYFDENINNLDEVNFVHHEVRNPYTSFVEQQWYIVYHFKAS